VTTVPATTAAITTSDVIVLVDGFRMPPFWTGTADE
jgi:hypothetical protein